MRVFLDANVLFSASKSGSAFHRAIVDAIEKTSVITSDVGAAETRKNLVLKRPDWVPLFNDLMESIEVVSTTVFRLPVDLASKDIPLLCAAVQAECDLFRHR